MNRDWLRIISNRFVKMFFIGGASAVILVAGKHPLVTFSELESWLVVLFNAFIVGGLAAIVKASQGYRPQ